MRPLACSPFWTRAEGRKKIVLNTARPSAATKLLDYGIRGKRGKGYRRIEKFVKNAMGARVVLCIISSKSFPFADIIGVSNGILQRSA